MKKITKKTLFALFVCIILLTSAAFVSSATEVDTEPLVMDLNASTSTKYTLNPEYLHTDSFIITGSNPDAEIYVWGNCNIN